MPYDIIGDVHGHADRLEALLAHMGYRHTAGAWRHPERTAIFVGDLIDRGPGQLRTLRIARAMTEAGSARVAMGNHEFNAIGWATPDPDKDGAFLRQRTGPWAQRSRAQHVAFLGEIAEDSPEHRDWAAWFMSLPVWIEEDGLRVIHACWDARLADGLRSQLTADLRLTPQALVAAHRRDSATFKAIDALLKGPEIDLPKGYKVKTADGAQRQAMRLAWWRSEARTYREAFVGPPNTIIPDVPLDPARRVPEPDRPTVIGHYWFDPKAAPTPAARRVACVDYSAGGGGPLVAYRFDGEAELSADKFVGV